MLGKCVPVAAITCGSPSGEGVCSEYQATALRACARALVEVPVVCTEVFCVCHHLLSFLLSQSTNPVRRGMLAFQSERAGDMTLSLALLSPAATDFLNISPNELLYVILLIVNIVSLLGWEREGELGDRRGDKWTKSFLLKNALYWAEKNSKARKGEIRVEWFGSEEAVTPTPRRSGLFHKGFGQQGKLGRYWLFRKNGGADLRKRHRLASR